MKIYGSKTAGIIAAAWGLGGVVLLLAQAIYRLSGYVFELGEIQLSWYHWLAITLNILFMAYSEGYRGFQQGFAPRVAARMKYLIHNPSLLKGILAPFFLMSFFAATRKRKIVSYSLTAGIIILILIIKSVPQPWRGIVDSGVVVGLMWGLISVFYYTVRSVTDKNFNFPNDLA